MKKVTKTVAMFVYRFSGLQYVVSEIESFVFRYRLRLRMVPISYKLFVLTLGVIIGGSGVFVRLEYSSLVTAEKWEYENPAINTVQAKEVETVEEWEKAEFSAYTASVDETDENPLIMASGKIVYIGAIACPRHVKLGTVIELKSGVRYTCEDRMNIRYKNNFDIFMTSKGEALDFGRKYLEYKVIQ